MIYNVGDRVKIKDFDWFSKFKNKTGNISSTITDYAILFSSKMSDFCGQVVTISTKICVGKSKYYRIMEDNGKYTWIDEMIEGLAEEILIEKVDDNGVPFNEWLSHEGAFYVPIGYVIKDKDGNVIDSQKIILEKKPEVIPSLQLDSFRTQREYCTDHSRVWLEIYEDNPSTCILTHLLVDEDYRLKGYGTKALEQAEMIAKNLGCNAVQLMVETDSWMHDWYLRRGYEFVEFDDDACAYTWLCKKL